MRITLDVAPMQFTAKFPDKTSVRYFLRNKFNFWSVHGIMNPSGLLQS